MRDSLRWRLSLWLSVAIMSTALMAGVLTFIGAFRDAQDLQDAYLNQIASLLEKLQRPANRWKDLDVPPPDGDESRILVQIIENRDPASTRARDGELALPVSPADEEGLITRDYDGEPYRILIKRLSSDLRIAVAQPTDLRDDIAEDSAITTLLPFAILLPLLLVLLTFLIRQFLKPISDLSHQIERHDSLSLQILPTESLPKEVRPFVGAINSLLHRVTEAMQLQRRFIAEAAHELRSPLTALSLQAERMASAQTMEQVAERLPPLQLGIERSRLLIDDLLSLARAQSIGHRHQGLSDVTKSVTAAIEQLLPLAERKIIDLGVITHQEGPLLVNAQEADLQCILKNLIDNAIRYSPDGGRIDIGIRLGDGSVSIEIEDNGPGIAAGERSRVIEPFYRIIGNQQPGSGLGLSIVHELVQRLGGSMELHDAGRSPTGLNVQVHLPAAEP